MKKKQRKQREKQASRHTQDTAHCATLREFKGAGINPAEQPKRTTDAPYYNDKPSWWKRLGKWGRKNGPTVIALLTFILALIAALQAYIYWQQLSGIKKDQRPWIRVLGDVQDIDPNNPKILVKWTISDFGKTPATKVEARFFIQKVTNGTSPSLQESYYAGGGYGTGVIFPTEPP